MPEEQRLETVLMNASGEMLDGRYEIFDKIGEGGMGAVYRGRQCSTGRPVAVKFLKATVNESDVARFEHEAQALSALSHPNLVSVIDFGYVEAGKPYIVLEYVDGTRLDRMLDRDDTLSDDLFKEIFSQI